jgi:predicted XRE-type DNA-binding protein
MEITTFESAFDAHAKNAEHSQKLHLRAELMTTLIKEVQSWGISQRLAAQKLGILQPRLNTLLKGKMGDFSLDSLIDLSLKAGLEVTIEAKKAA